MIDKAHGLDLSVTASELWRPGLSVFRFYAERCINLAMADIRSLFSSGVRLIGLLVAFTKSPHENGEY